MASMGVALIGLAGIVPWLYLREPFDLLIETSKLPLLSQTAQDVITFRQKLVHCFSYALPWISLVLLVSGLVFLFIGLIRWKKKQQIQDDKERLDYEAVKKQSLKMSDAEVTAKILEDTSDESNPKANSPRAFPTNDSVTPKRILNSKSDSEIRVQKAKEIEKRVLELIEPIVKGEYEVMHQRKIAGRTFDAIFASKSSETSDRLVEIKYFNSSPNKDMFYRLHDRMVATAIAYTGATGRRARGIVIVVVPNEEVKKATRNLWFQAMLNTLKKRVEPGVSVISENDIENNNSEIAEIVWEVSQFEL